MKEKIIEVITVSAPLIAGVVTSVAIPLIIKVKSLKYLKKKIDEVNEAEELKELKKEVSLIHKEILEMRGKRKWENIL